VSPFGDRLRRARESKGLSLAAIAEATRIATRHLSALERGDLEALPPGPFAKGYIRAYAEYVGIDAEPILQAYRSEEERRGLDAPGTRDRVIEEMSHLLEKRAGAPGHSGRPVLGGKMLAIAFFAACVLGTAGWLLSRARTPRGAGAPAPAPSQARPTSSPSPAAPSASDAARPARPRAPSKLQVADAGVGTDVRDHQLVGSADRFRPGTRVAFWTRVLGGQPGDSIRHVWFHEGQAVMRADLEVSGPSWRTYSRLDLPEAATGSWAVEARGPDGQLLARREFECAREAP
jgi:transcriptional regulator with XRE-family HTH domain